MHTAHLQPFDPVTSRLFGVDLGAPDARQRLLRAIPSDIKRSETQRDEELLQPANAYVADIFPEFHLELHWSTRQGGALRRVFADFLPAAGTQVLSTESGLASTDSLHAVEHRLASARGVEQVERRIDSVVFSAHGFRVQLRWEDGAIVEVIMARESIRPNN